MSNESAVRLPEHMVEQIDTLVSDAAVPGRAALVQNALERELRRRIHEQEVETLLALKAAGEPDEFAEHAARTAHSTWRAGADCTLDRNGAPPRA